MNCKEVQRRLQPLLDGDLDAEILRQVQSHLKQCPECTALKRDFESLGRLAKTELPARAPEDFEGRLRMQLDAAGRRRRFWTFRPPSLAWGAAAALILIVSSVFFASDGSHERQPEVLPSLPISEARVSPVVLPADPGMPHMHIIVPDDPDNVLVRIPSTVRITRAELNQDFFLSEVSH
ncbi:MAG: zf-HC2 domain-containing protein [Acidobacteria bacterium]|nr:zf-HC2 domain-containing protein [Acidobacteriota bacterium]